MPHSHIPIMFNFTLYVCARFLHGEHWCANQCLCSPTRRTTPDNFSLSQGVLCPAEAKLHWYGLPHSKNRIVIFTINLSCLLQMSEPIWCMDTANCQDGMIMWRKVGLEWGKDCHLVLLHIVMNCVHSSESEITNCQSLWRFLFYSAVIV